MTRNEIILEVAQLDEPHQKWEIFQDIFLNAPTPYTLLVGYRYPAHTGWIIAKSYTECRDVIIPVITKCITTEEMWNAFKEADVDAIKSEMHFDDATPVWKTHMSIFQQSARCLSIALLKTLGKWKP